MCSLMLFDKRVGVPMSSYVPRDNGQTIRSECDVSSSHGLIGSRCTDANVCFKHCGPRMSVTRGVLVYAFEMRVLASGLPPQIIADIASSAPHLKHGKRRNLGLGAPPLFTKVGCTSHLPIHKTSVQVPWPKRTSQTTKRPNC